MKEFVGKYAVITGATSGIGAETAILMAERGLAGVVIVGRNEARGKEVVEKCLAFGCDAHFSICDICEEESIRKTVESAFDVFPHIDILINNAGISPYDQPWDVETSEHFDYVISTNLKSQFLFSQPIAKHMLERQYGKIVNVSSCVARTGSGLSLSYAASKGAILSMTRSMAKVLGPYNINVNAVLPGVIETPMTEEGDYTEQVKSWPLRRMGKARELAEVCAFMASDRSSYMSGAGVDANGGYVMG